MCPLPGQQGSASLHAFKDIQFDLYLRKPYMSIQDKTTHIYRLAPICILQDSYKALPRDALKIHHLSYDQFKQWICLELGSGFNPDNYQMGCLLDLGQRNYRAIFMEIKSQISFHNVLDLALGMQSEVDTLQPLRIEVWSPRPTNGPMQTLTPLQYAALNQTNPLTTNLSPTLSAREHDLYDADDIPKHQPTLAETSVPPLLLTESPQPVSRVPVLPSTSHPSEKSPNYRLPSPKDVLPESNQSSAASPQRVSPESEDDEDPISTGIRKRKPLSPNEIEDAETEDASRPGGRAIDDSLELDDIVPPQTVGEGSFFEDMMDDKSDSSDSEDGRGDVDLEGLLNLTTAPVKQPERENFQTEEAWEEELARWNELNAAQSNQNLINSMDTAACMHVLEGHWPLICEIFGHNSTQTAPEYVVEIPFLQRKLLPIQAHGVFWTLQIVHGEIGSLFLAHIMGIGKTTQLITVYLTQHIFNMIWNDIFCNPSLHWDSNTMEESQACPSNSRIKKIYQYACPCHIKSPTHFIKQRCGVNVILVPTSLIENWKREWSSCHPTLPDRSEMQLLVAHNQNTSVSDDRKRMTDNLVGKELKTFDVVDTADGKIQVPGRSTYQPRPENSRQVVLSTSDSIQTQFLTPFSKAYTTSYRPIGEMKKNSKGVEYMTKPHDKIHSTREFSTVYINMVGKDECQLRRSKTRDALVSLKPSTFSKHLDNKQLSTLISQPVAFILLSGTPMSAGPSDIFEYIKIMQRPSWLSHPVLSKWCGSELEDLGTRWTKVLANRVTPFAEKEEQVKQMITQIRPLIESLFLRVNNDSTFLNHKCVKVPRVAQIPNLKVEHPDKWQKASLEFAQKEVDSWKLHEQRRRLEWSKTHNSFTNFVPSKAGGNTFYRSRLVASFPALQTLQNEDGSKLSLTQAEWEEKKWTYKRLKRTPPHNIYLDNLDLILGSSGKMIALGKMLDWFEREFDTKGRISKHIFCSAFHSGAYLMYQYLLKRRKVPEEQIVFLTKLNMSAKETEELLEKFTGSSDSAQDHNARFIVTTSQCFSVGLTLTQAISVTFLEPDYRPDVMAQGYARHYRQGSIWEKVFIGLLEASGNIVEERIMNQNKLKGIFDTAMEETADTKPDMDFFGRFTDPNDPALKLIREYARSGDDKKYQLIRLQKSPTLYPESIFRLMNKKELPSGVLFRYAELLADVANRNESFSTRFIDTEFYKSDTTGSQPVDQRVSISHKVFWNGVGLPSDDLAKNIRTFFNIKWIHIPCFIPPPPSCTIGHWVLATVCPATKTIYYFDSLGTGRPASRKIQDDIIYSIRRTLIRRTGTWEEMAIDFDEWKILIRHRKGIQSNHWGCGYYVMYEMASLTLSTPYISTTSNSEFLKGFALHIASSIMAGRLMLTYSQ